MKLAIDASNIRAGGGLTHLSQILNALGELPPPGYSSITIFAGRSALARIQQKSWLHLQEVSLLNQSMPIRVFWQQFILPRIMKNFDALYSPGGTLCFLCSKPSITMSQNMLPFEKKERNRYPFFSWMRLKLCILKFVQGVSFSQASGLIFLTEYAKSSLQRVLQLSSIKSIIIPHGIEKRFFQRPRHARELSDFQIQNPARILYVSIVDLYKHQWNVVEAVAKLRAKGFNLELSLIGPAYLPALQKLNDMIERVDSAKKFIHYLGPIPFEKLESYYQNADLFLFASSCENLPNIMIEAMAAGLPILSANKGPMPEVLKDAGGYFDPENVDDLASQIQNTLQDTDLRKRWSESAYQEAQQYSWQQCSEATFRFIRKIAKENR